MEIRKQPIPTKNENSHCINTSPCTDSVRKSGLKPPSVSKLPANFRRKSTDPPPSFLKELEDVVSKGESVLDKGNAWSDRNSFIQKLGNLFSSQKSLETTEAEHAVVVLQVLVPAFKLHLQDVRSAVVRSTCETVGSISKSTGLEFQSIATELIATLLSLSNITIKIVSQSGENCVKTLIETTRFDLEVVFDACQNGKSEALCKTACEYLTKALEQWTTLKEEDSSYQSYLKASQACLTHQFKKVRRSGCELLTQMANVWPKQVTTLAALLEPSMINVFLTEYPASALTEHLRLHHVVKSPIKSSGLSEYKRRASKSKSVSPKQTESVDQQQQPSSSLSMSAGAPTRQEEWLKWMSVKESKSQSNGKLRQRHSDMASPTLKTLLPAYQKRFEASKRPAALSENKDDLMETKKQAQEYLKQAEELDFIRRYGGQEQENNPIEVDIQQELVIPPVVQHTPPGKTTKYVPSSNTVRKVAQKLAKVCIEDDEEEEAQEEDVTETLADSFDTVATPPVKKESSRMWYLVLFLVGFCSAVVFSFLMPLGFSALPITTSSMNETIMITDAEIHAETIIAQAKAEQVEILAQAHAKAKAIEFKALNESKVQDLRIQEEMEEAKRLKQEADEMRKEAKAKIEQMKREAEEMKKEAIMAKQIQQEAEEKVELLRQEQLKLITDMAKEPEPLTTAATSTSSMSYTTVAAMTIGLFMAIGVAGRKWFKNQLKKYDGGWEYEACSDPKGMRCRSVVDSPHFSDPCNSPDAGGLLGWISPPTNLKNNRQNFSDPGNVLGSFSTVEEQTTASPKTPRSYVRRSSRLSTPRRK